MVIPADWKEVRLGDLGMCLRGVSYKGDSDLSDGDTPTTVRLLRSNNVQNSLIQFNDVQYVNHDCVSDEQILRRDDIVICMANGSKVLVGKTGLYKDSQGARYTFGAFMGCFRSSSDQAHAIFVRYLFLTKQYQDYISNLLAGSSINNLTPKSIESLLFNVPPLKEQEVIAEALSDADAAIESLDALIAKKRDVKQATMQQLLTGRTRLPGFTGDWETVRLEDFADCFDHLRVPLNESERLTRIGDYPYCGANGVLGFIDRYLIDDEMVLIAEDGGYFDEFATRPIAYKMSGKFWVNNHAHVLKAKPSKDNNYLYYSLVHKDVTPYLASGTRAKLNKSEMWKIEIRAPKSITEQEAIAEALTVMDDELEALSEQASKLRMVKEGMMQDLLTGKVRLV